MAKKRNILSKRNGTYQVVFKGKELQCLELLLKSNVDDRHISVSQLVRDLLNIAFYQYLNNREKFVEDYGVPFFQHYFENIDILREKQK